MPTVSEVIELTGQKRGTIEQFRELMLKYGIIGNNETLNERAFKVFKKVIKSKEEENTTWALAIEKEIQAEYGEELNIPFRWSKNIILNDLIRSINKGTVIVTRDLLGLKANKDLADDEFFYTIFHVLIENFYELSKTDISYTQSSGADGNAITSYELSGKDFKYYLVGKFNHVTNSEDIHVFYNEGLDFNIMRCKHICGGPSNKGLLKELWELCLSLRPSKDDSLVE